jgi:hypothetical protein
LCAFGSSVHVFRARRRIRILLRLQRRRSLVLTRLPLLGNGVSSAHGNRACDTRVNPGLSHVSLQELSVADPTENLNVKAETGKSLEFGRSAGWQSHVPSEINHQQQRRFHYERQLRHTNPKDGAACGRL